MLIVKLTPILSFASRALQQVERSGRRGASFDHFLDSNSQHEPPRGHSTQVADQFEVNCYFLVADDHSPYLYSLLQIILLIRVP